MCSQVAQGQDGSFRRFAILEYSTPEMAEEVQRLTDGRPVGGSRVRVSFCAPGPPGRSMLAALIAAQTLVSSAFLIVRQFSTLNFFILLTLASNLCF